MAALRNCLTGSPADQSFKPSFILVNGLEAQKVKEILTRAAAIKPFPSRKAELFMLKLCLFENLIFLLKIMHEASLS